jgi:1,4-dihydroxy-2-naphthoate octaprenyltransferase
MKQIDYNAFTLEELKNKEKVQKTVTGIFMGSIIVMLIAGIYITVVGKAFSVFSVLPVAFLPLLIVNMNNMKQIKKAIELKEQQG